MSWKRDLPIKVLTIFAFIKMLCKDFEDVTDLRGRVQSIHPGFYHKFT
jgi:hypothetical protein